MATRYFSKSDANSSIIRDYQAKANGSTQIIKKTLAEISIYMDPVVGHLMDFLKMNRTQLQMDELRLVASVEWLVHSPRYLSEVMGETYVKHVEEKNAMFDWIEANVDGFTLGVFNFAFVDCKEAAPEMVKAGMHYYESLSNTANIRALKKILEVLGKNEEETDEILFSFLKQMFIREKTEIPDDGIREALKDIKSFEEYSLLGEFPIASNPS